MISISPPLLIINCTQKRLQSLNGLKHASCKVMQDILSILMKVHDTSKKIVTRIDSGLKDLTEDLKAMAKDFKLEEDQTS